jgi:hypothetical protein
MCFIVLVQELVFALARSSIQSSLLRSGRAEREETLAYATEERAAIERKRKQ